MKTSAAFFIGVLFFAGYCKGQTNVYHPFKHEGGEWNILLGEGSSEPFDTVYSLENFTSYGDTIIEGKTFFKYGVLGSYNFLREDTLNRKIYLLKNYPEPEEFLLYDFNLEAGESATTSIEFINYPDAFVKAVDSILIDTTYRRRLNIKYTRVSQNLCC